MNVTDQRAAALDAANKIRVDRAKLHRQVSAGEVSARRILEVTPPSAEKVEVFSFLHWLPMTGRRRALQIMRRAGVPGYRQLAELTDDQRASLLGAIESGTHPAERNLS